MSKLEIALFLHILGAVLLISGAAVAAVAFESARRRREPSEIALLLSTTRIGVALVGTGALLVLAFGLWLVDLEGWDFGTGWIQTALGLYVVAMVLGALGGQKPKRARLLASELAAAGEGETPQLRALLDDRAAQILNYASSLTLLVILGLMVFKP